MSPPAAEPDPVPGRGRLPERFDALLTAAGLIGPFRRDCALGVLVAGMMALVVGLLATGVDPDVAFDPPGLAALLVLTTAQGLLLALRRTTPVLCLGLVVGMQVVVFAAVPPDLTLRGPAPLIAAYTCGVLLAPRRAARLVPAAALVESIGFVALLFPVPSVGALIVPASAQLISAALTYGAATLIGAYIAARRGYVALLRARAAEAERAQRARTDDAVRRERSRMARELHDVAAHHLSGMVVQAAMVERLVDRDPEQARRIAGRVREQGRETLRDLRMVVGALRDPGSTGQAPEDDAPVPGLAALDRLVATTRELGTPVTVERRGEIPELPPIADVAGHRVVQEALANAREHAPGAAVRIVLERVSDELRIEIVNDAPDVPPTGPGEGRGFGLVGMRERAQLVGARFEAGPTGPGGWRVCLALRVEPEAAP
ncbi:MULTISPECIES: sensor histidine kinase [Pseudonocardia]|uniref:histidine kinase n=2 Tax=Pseudonocardia TaxID=1847 RepID=A0A1Y2MMK3_PSEAH|nr:MULTISPECIES: histidine kinase [Pseudonocardia]OSY36473.1 Signal transduction histidine-protein kinase/phosphatase DegS [Pseudonocardia autotrophica]TDN74765.1 signal transduction histidine kinase [Pseudonocardia autotrophica]